MPNTDTPARPPEYGAATGSPDRVPEADRKMIFHVCQKLAVVLGLNAQEQAWLESLGATFPNSKLCGAPASAPATVRGEK